jgi:hypothetical protein
MADEADPRGVHPADYLARCAALFDAGSGELGVIAPSSPGSYEIA